MNSLLDKVAALVEINVRSLIGQSHRDKNAASFFRHYMQIEQNLIDIENAIAISQGQIDAVAKKGRRSDEQVAEIDQLVDQLLLKGDDSGARRAQIHWNDAKRLNIQYRAQIRELDLEQEKLLRAKDKLEVQLSMMEDEKNRLQDLYHQYKNEYDPEGRMDPGRNQEKVYWVVEPEEA